MSAETPQKAQSLDQLIAAIPNRQWPLGYPVPSLAPGTTLGPSPERLAEFQKQAEKMRKDIEERVRQDSLRAKERTALERQQDYHRQKKESPKTPRGEHPLGTVQFPLSIQIPYVELALSRSSISDADLITKYGPPLLHTMLDQIERWRTSHEIDPVSPREQTEATSIPSDDDDRPFPADHQDEPPCSCVMCYEDSL
jgi:hypothetical protein